MRQNIYMPKFNSRIFIPLLPVNKFMRNPFAKRFLALSVLSALCISSVSSLPALAASNLEEGMKLYKEKKYREAKPYLIKAAEEDPKSWQAHFYLGHTYMTLGRMADAKHQYALAKHSTNHPAVHAHCDKALENVDGYYSALKPKPAASTGDDGETKEENKEPSHEDIRKAKIEAKREEVLSKAKEECAAIRKAAEDQITAEKANSNQRFRYSDGSRGMDISDEREAQIRGQAEDKCRHIMDNAQRKARSYR